MGQIVENGSKFLKWVKIWKWVIVFEKESTFWKLISACQIALYPSHFFPKLRVVIYKWCTRQCAYVCMIQLGPKIQPLHCVLMDITASQLKVDPQWKVPIYSSGGRTLLLLAPFIETDCRCNVALSPCRTQSHQLEATTISFVSKGGGGGGLL